MTEELERELKTLNDGLAKLRKDLAANYAPRRETVRQRRRLALVLLGLMVVLAVGGYVTSRVTLAREHHIVAECFLLPGRLSPAKVAECGRTFPGYADVQRQSRANLKVFVDLQARVKRLEAAQKGNR